MATPSQDRSLDSLHSKQKAAVVAFIAAAKAKGFDVRVSETRRTKARQAYLYSCNTASRWVTNCDGTRNISMHQYGIATDLLLYHKDGTLNWDTRVWRTLYAQVPPAKFGLETIPQELCHLQLAGSQAHVTRGGFLDANYVQSLGLKLT